MKIKYLLLTFFFFTNAVHLVSQVTIKGKVLDDKNEPLEGAAVYLNNTSIGTTTNDSGEFELRIKEGSYDLIVSFFSFETVQYSLNTDNYSNPLTFKLTQKNNLLDEIVISNKKKKISAEDRAYFMRQFKKNFLGKTNLSKECEILNEEVIDFDYDKATNTLKYRRIFIMAKKGGGVVEKPVFVPPAAAPKAAEAATEETTRVSQMTDSARDYVKRAAETAKDRTDSAYENVGEFNKGVENMMTRLVRGYVSILEGAARVSHDNVKTGLFDLKGVRGCAGARLWSVTRVNGCR